MARKQTTRLGRSHQRIKPQVAVRDSRLGERASLFLTSAFFLGHAVGLVLLFNPVSGLVDTAPLIDQDWGLHFHHLKALETFWRQDGLSWGYNPYFMAGYPSNTIQDLSIKFFEWLAIALSTFALSPVQWFKNTAFLATASIPWMMFVAARNFFASDESRNRLAVLAAFLGTIYWWNSLPREMFFYGVIGFPIASYLSVLGVSLFYRLALNPPQPTAIFISYLLFAVIIAPLHVQSVLIVVPPVLALLALQPRLLTPRLTVWLVAAACGSIIVNLIWLVPALSHRGDDASAAIVQQLPLFADTNGFAFFLDYLSPHGYWSFRPSFFEKGLRLTLLVLGIIGIVRLIRTQKKELATVLAGAAIVLFLVAYFGALIPVMKPWQPLRFKVPLDLFLIVGTAYCVNQWLIFPRSSPFVPIILTCGLLAFLINLAQTESAGRLQLRSRFIPELDAIVDWVKHDAPTTGRVLFEESGDESGFVYDRTYLSSFLPALTGRQLIGGPINLYNDRHHFAEFHSGQLFKRDVRSISDQELRDYLSRYNIGAIVCFDTVLIQRLRSIPGLVTIEQTIGPIHLMKVKQPLSWFLSGEGKVAAGYNRLQLSELKGAEAILKYHWVAGLTAQPFAKIEAIKVADDPIPFIKIVNPPPSLTLRVASSLLDGHP